jgi:hypothetical protein
LRPKPRQSGKQRLVVCIDNEDYAASLKKRTIYVARRDPAAERRGLLRVIGESCDDYLYPKGMLPPDRVPARRQQSDVGRRSSLAAWVRR